MENEIVKIAINKSTLATLESLAAHRKVSMDRQIDHAFALFIGFYTLTKKQRGEILKLMAKPLLGASDG